MKVLKTTLITVILSTTIATPVVATPSPNSIGGILKVSGLKATCQTDFEAGTAYPDGDFPYDIKWE